MQELNSRGLPMRSFFSFRFIPGLLGPAPVTVARPAGLGGDPGGCALSRSNRTDARSRGKRMSCSAPNALRARCHTNVARIPRRGPETRGNGSQTVGLSQIKISPICR